MAMSSHPESIAVPLVVTVLSAVLCGALYFVAGTAGIGIFALSAPFGIMMLWAARNVETLQDHLAPKVVRVVAARR